MGLIKEIDTKFGVTASYHKITCTNLNNTSIEVSVYYTKQAKENKAIVMWRKTYSVPEDVITEDKIKVLNKTSLKLAYEYLKTLEDYVDAEDDL